MKEQRIPDSKSALDSSDNHPYYFEWEWPAVFILLSLATFWLFRVHLQNKKEKQESQKICQNSLHKKSSEHHSEP